MHRYLIIVETGQQSNWRSVSDIPVHVKLTGDHGDSEELILNDLPSTLRYEPPKAALERGAAASAATDSPSMSPLASTSDMAMHAAATDQGVPLFSTGSVREFETTLPYIGNLVKLRVRRDMTNADEFDSAWRLEKILVSDDTIHRGWTCVAAKWLNADTANDIELEPSGYVASGRRATNRVQRRLANPAGPLGDALATGSHAGLHDAQPAASRFEKNKSWFQTQANSSFTGISHSGSTGGLGSLTSLRATDGSGPGSTSMSIGTSSIASDGPLSPRAGAPAASSFSDGGVRRVCFSISKFERPGCHLYLVGDTDILGRWRASLALRMRMVTSGDGSDFNGRWSLDMEIDDTSATIEYGYMVFDERVGKAWWEEGSQDNPRVLRLTDQSSASNRSVEGGILHIDDTFRSVPDGPPSEHIRLHAPERAQSFRESTRPPKTKSEVYRRERSADAPMRGAPGHDAFSLFDDEEIQVDEELLSADQVAAYPRMRSRSPYEHPPLRNMQHMVEQLSTPMRPRTSRVSSADAELMALSPDELRRQLKAVRKVLTEREGYVLALKGQLDSVTAELHSSTVVVTCEDDSVPGDTAEQVIPTVIVPPSPHPQPSPSEARTSPVSSDTTPHARGLVDEVDAFEGLDVQTPRGDCDTPDKRAIGACGAADASARISEEAMRSAAQQLNEDCEGMRAELLALRRQVAEGSESFASYHAELVRHVMDAQEAKQAQMNALLEERDTAMQRWAREFGERRRLFNLVQELRGNIRVFCRVRPLKRPLGASLEEGDSSSMAVSFPDAELDRLGIAASTSIQVSGKTFEFDHVFAPDTTQEKVYEETSGVVASVLDGYNVCVFAYGQTGSGKTYTMNGPTSDPGVNFRALTDLFSHIEERSSHSTFEVSVSMLEIYNENLRDLIYDGEVPPKLEIRKDPVSTSPNAVYVPNLTVVAVQCVDEIWSLMERGAQNRAQHATDMNEHSSRSHLILSVNVLSTNTKTGSSTNAQLSLVDLAGSERLSRSGATGDRMREAQHINKSLSTLGDVFMALLEKNAHIPYRNSKLTYLLQESLGGDSKTLMFVNVSCDQADTGETTSSLTFAQRVAKVERGAASRQTGNTGAPPRVVGASSSAISEKEQQISSLQERLVVADRECKKRAEKIEELQAGLRTCETELKSANKLIDEQRRKEGSEKKAASASAAATARELKDLKAQEEKRKEELRVSKLKLRDSSAAKDDEIRRLKTAVDERDARIRRLQLEHKSTSSIRGGVGASGGAAGAGGSAGGARIPVRGRLPPRTAAGSRTFSTSQASGAGGMGRQVRFQAGTHSSTPNLGAARRPLVPPRGRDDGDKPAAETQRLDPLSSDVSSDGEAGVASAEAAASDAPTSDSPSDGSVGDATTDGDAEVLADDPAPSTAPSTAPSAAPSTAPSASGTTGIPQQPSALPRRRPSIPRSGTATSIRGTSGRGVSLAAAGRQPSIGSTSIGAGSAAAGKRVMYAFGSRVEAGDSAAGSGAGAPAAQSRTARSTPNLRPAQRLVAANARTTGVGTAVSADADSTAAQGTSRVPTRSGPGLPRRAGTFANAGRVGAAQQR